MMPPNGGSRRRILTMYFVGAVSVHHTELSEKPNLQSSSAILAESITRSRGEDAIFRQIATPFGDLPANEGRAFCIFEMAPDGHLPAHIEAQGPRAVSEKKTEKD